MRGESIQIIGGGPGGLGLPIAAAAKQRLPELLSQGLTIIEQDKLGGGGLCGTIVRSNSEAIEFVEPIGKTEAFQDVLKTPEAQAVLAYGHDIVALDLVGAFINQVGKRVENIVTSSRGGTVHKAKVDHVVFNQKQQTYTTTTAENQKIATSSVLVYAAGSEEKPYDFGSDELNAKRILASDFFKNEKIRRDILTLLGTDGNKRIAILGGRHSAFSAAAKLLELSDREKISLPDGAVTLITKTLPRVFYNSADEADNDHYIFDPQTDICPVSGRVNRFTGVRGDAKAIYQRIVRNEEPRVKVVTTVQKPEVSTQIKDASIIIQATGYTVREIPLFDADGAKIGPSIQGGRARVNATCQLYSHSDEVLPKVFGIGTGYGISPSAEIGGEQGAVVEALNFYWTVVGNIVLEQILSERG